MYGSSAIIKPLKVTGDTLALTTQWVKMQFFLEFLAGEQYALHKIGIEDSVQGSDGESANERRIGSVNKTKGMP